MNARVTNIEHDGFTPFELCIKVENKMQLEFLHNLFAQVDEHLLDSTDIVGREKVEMAEAIGSDELSTRRIWAALDNEREKRK